MARTHIGAACILAAGLVAACVDPAAEFRENQATARQPAEGDDPLTRDELVRLELHLQQLGYLGEAADGDIGPSARAAIGAFQQQSGQRATGSYTYALLETLEQAVSKQDAGAGGQP